MKPILYVLPGLDGTGDLMQYPARYLEEIFDVHIVSYPNDTKLTYLELADLIEGILPPKKKFHLLGESYAGPLCIELALRKKSQLKSLVLSASFIDNPMYGSAIFKGANSLFPLSIIPKSLLHRIFFSDRKTDELSKLLDNILKTVNYDVIKHRIQNVLTHKINPDIGTIDIPVLYLCGKSDLLITRHNADRIKNNLPQAKIVNISAGHMVLQTNENECKKALLDFYDNVTF